MDDGLCNRRHKSRNVAGIESRHTDASRGQHVYVVLLLQARNYCWAEACVREHAPLSSDVVPVAYQYNESYRNQSVGQ